MNQVKRMYPYRRSLKRYFKLLKGLSFPCSIGVEGIEFMAYAFPNPERPIKQNKRVQFSRLRSKIDRPFKGKQMLYTERGAGYALRYDE